MQTVPDAKRRRTKISEESQGMKIYESSRHRLRHVVGRVRTMLVHAELKESELTAHAVHAAFDSAVEYALYTGNHELVQAAEALAQQQDTLCAMGNVGRATWCA